jgi:hypothetical protein
MGAIAAIVGAAVSSFGLGGIIAGTTIFGLNAFGSFLVRAAIGIALNALSPKPKTPSLSGDTRSRGYNVNQRGSALDHQIIYGRARVGGAIVFRGTTGTDNKFLHEVIAYTGHEIESFDEIYINDERVTAQDTDGFVTEVTSPDGSTSGRYANYIRINQHFGTADQSADPDLVSEVAEWTNDHRLRGCSYLYIRYAFDGDVFPNGVPQVTATIKGKKVYDPRSDTTAWSDNPALCLRDYLTNGYGLDEAAANVDDTLIGTAADVCDETDTDAGTTRYTCNGNFTTQDTPYDILNDLLTCMGGLLWYAQGKWRMKPAYWTAPSVEFTEDDLRSSVSVKTRHSRRDNFNTVKGTFRGEETDWQVTDYPEVTNQTFIDADNGQESVVDIELPFTDNSIEARRISRIILERNRQQLTVSAAFGLRAFQVQVGDNIQLSIDRFGWAQKEFEVVAWTFGLAEGMELQVQMTLREISESVFDEVDDGIVYERDNTTLVSAFEAQAPGIALDAELRIINEQVAGVLKINLTGGDAGFRDYFEVEYKPSSESEYIFVGSGTDKRFEVPFIQDGNYDIKARSVSYLGVRSPYNTITNWYASVFDAPPSNVENFTGNVVGNSLHLTWSPVSDLDLSHYKIRYATETSGASYQNAVDLVPKVSRPGVSVTVPAKTGTYFIKAIDKLGIPSAAATSFVVVTNISQVENLNVVNTLTEHTAFSGSKTDVVRTENGGDPYITLDTDENFDDVTGDFDDQLGLFDGGGEADIASSGIYEFANYIDLGEKYTSRVQVDLTTIFLEYSNTFDSAPGLFDDREGNFDGDQSQFDRTSVQAQVSYTDDDPSGAPSWSAWQNISVSDISARAIRFRVILSTQLGDVAPAVTELTATVDMPDRLESDDDITYTGSNVVTFPVAFKATPAIGIAATLADGDRYVISNKSRTGFTITTYTGASVSTNATTFDYVAKGYGREIA